MVKKRSRHPGRRRKAEPEPKAGLISRIEARELLGGIADRTFAKLEADGIIAATVRGSGRRPSQYDPFSITQAYIAHVRSINMGADREARAQRDRSQAELNELRLKQQRKELLPRDQVVREGKAYIVAVRAKLLALPRRMTQAGLVPAERQVALVDLIHEALEEMTQWRTQLDLLASRGADG